MRPTPLDEYPLHQAPLPIARPVSSDRNFYDRCYLNAHDRSGDLFLITGFGTYPTLGVKDAFATIRLGDTQHAVRFSDALGARGLDQQVGGYRIEVLDPLERLRVVCEHPDLSFDLTWEGSFPAILEQRHLMMQDTLVTLDAQRFAQVGSWSGALEVAGSSYDVAADTWVGTRDRSWGIRPVGEAAPPGRPLPMDGLWWLYVPIRFDDFALVVILQESPDGHRTLNDASRVFADGRVEQLGWPRVEIDYVPGSRHPRGARLHLTTPAGEALVVDVETLTGVALHVGCGYGGDPEWTHGRWMGDEWMSASSYDLTTQEIRDRLPWGVTDHVARATCGDAVGWGLFEHASMGRHDPSGFADWGSVR